MAETTVTTKALTIAQPWATLVAIGAKQIETRSWQTNNMARYLRQVASVLQKEQDGQSNQ